MNVWEIKHKSASGVPLSGSINWGLEIILVECEKTMIHIFNFLFSYSRWLEASEIVTNTTITFYCRWNKFM